jgi:hypothetical protein
MDVDSIDFPEKKKRYKGYKKGFKRKGRGVIILK